jgi:predicted transcriptional regulator
MKHGKKLMEPISIRLEPDVKAALQELASADERSLSSYINRALRQHIEAARGKRPKTKSGSGDNK